MARRVLVAIAVLAATAALFVAAEAQQAAAQQGHQTERISGEGPCLDLIAIIFVSLSNSNCLI